jgi:hypothetical protein
MNICFRRALGNPAVYTPWDVAARSSALSLARELHSRAAYASISPVPHRLYDSDLSEILAQGEPPERRVCAHEMWRGHRKSGEVVICRR